jgi:VanZ family protein
MTPAGKAGRPARRHPLVAYAPALAWAAFLLWLGGRRDVPMPAIDLPIDKLAHFVIYGVLGLLAALGRVRAGGRPAAPIVAAIAIACGILDEIHQRTVPGRSPELADAVVDATAIVVAFAFVHHRVRRGKDE